MQNYKSVPDHLTEDDILSNIKQVEEDILEERIPNTRSKKRILSVLSKSECFKTFSQETMRK